MVEGFDTVYMRDGLKGLEGVRNIGQALAWAIAEYIDACSD